MKGDLDLALHWDRAAPAFQEMVHIGPGSLKFARRSRLYICMYVFMYYACMYVCMYVFMYVCLYISSLRPSAVAVRSAHKAFGRTKNSLSQQSRRVFGCK